MKKHQFILILSLILLYLLFFYLNYPTPKDRKVYLSDLNKSIVNLNKKIAIDSENIYPSSYLLWGLKRSKILEKREMKTKTKKEIRKKTIKKEKLKKDIKLVKRTICLEKKCWEFMGVVIIGNKYSVKLLPKEKKSKLETFKVGDSLLEDLMITKIKGESMTLLNKVKNKKITLKLFDVNISQYSPKTIKEKNE